MFAWNWNGESRGSGSSLPGRRPAGSGHRRWHWVLLMLLALLAWALPGPAHAQASAQVTGEVTGEVAGPAAGAVAVGRATPPVLTVTFVEPQRYADAGDTLGGRADPELLALLKRQLETSAARCLPAGQMLSIRVLDVDLAGDVDIAWWRFGDSIRVLRERARPRVELAYTLTQGDARGAELREQIVDSNYLMHLGRARYDNARLPHERAMLARWFEARFCAAAAGAVY